MREILAAFINRAEGAIRVPLTGGEPIPVKIDERVAPPGLFTSEDKDQLARLTRSGCLSPVDMSHGGLRVDTEAFLRQDAAHVAATMDEGSPASQDGGGDGTGSDAEPRSDEPGSRPASLAGGDKGADPGERAEPDSGGRRPRRGGQGAKPKP